MYESIVNSTVSVLSDLPTPVPETGRLVGFGREHIVPFQDMFLGDNYHYPLGTAYLTYGVSGISEKAQARSKEVTDPVRQELLKGISTVYREIADYLKRYAAAVEAKAGDDARLQHIAEMLRALSDRAPEHFEEALQLVYLMWKLRCLNSFCAAIGRLDVHLRPFYERDIATGYVTDEDVLALILEFWEALNRNNSGDTLINVMVGGKTIDGTDAGGRLSVLMLEATKRCAKTEPHINVRVSRDMDPALRRAMTEVQLMGHGQATVYNDDVLIPSLIAGGVPEEIAYCYANDGCTEVTLDGYSGIDFNHIDAVAVFELAFNNGRYAERTYRKPVKYFHKDNEERYYVPDAVVGYASGRVEDCATFDEFYRMFLDQYLFQVRSRAKELKQMEADRLANGRASLLLNGTFDFVLESGQDVLRGGFPYTHYMMFSGSIPTVADCLMAIKRKVFDEKVYTIPEIKEAILANYEGYEAMRQELLSAPKFGNDIDEVDLLSADIAAQYCRELEVFGEQTGFHIFPALLGWRFLEEAYGIAATPDGRRYGDPIAEHYCPTPGRAVEGPTAIINSIAKAKPSIAQSAGVCAVHLTLPSGLGFDREQALAVVDSLVWVAMDRGLNQMNIAIYDIEQLRAAQRDPEHHRDVIVRVWGYSARFVDLCEEMQEHVISRIARASC